MRSGAPVEVVASAWPRISGEKSGGTKRFERGQRHARAESAQKTPAAKVGETLRGEIGEAVVEADALDCAGLCGAQSRTGLDEMHLAHESAAAHDSQCIGGERSPARPQLGIDRFAWRPGAEPAVGERGTDEFTKHLRNFGCGREVAVRAERIARRVIMGVAGGHIVIDRDPALGDDSASQLVGEARQAMLSIPAIGSTR